MTMTVNGWCIHGVPYGLNWSCAQCGSVPDAATRATYTPPPFTEDDKDRLFRSLDRITTLLERIAGISR